MTKKILTYGDVTLRKKAQSVANITHEIDMLIDSLYETMFNAGGIGLAAVQVGILQRIVVAGVPEESGAVKKVVLINPEIREHSSTVIGEEGCLSFPGIRAEVARSDIVVVKAIGRDGEERTFEAEGLLSRVLQHEIDHLEGVLFIDRISAVARALIRSQLNKLKRETERGL